ncbi:MAG TPA: glutathione S-transferase family protein [Burkholderiales bacterium]|nr:glutathione S-transferase family protein [Burkholderiales bacterium]
MIVLYHLNNSRSQRIVWLLEELGTPYRIEKYRRDPKTNLAPPELRAVHPLGKAPVIQDGDLMVSESGAIAEYLVEQHGNGRLAPRRGTKEHVRYLQWMHFAEGTLMLHLMARLYITRVGGDGAAPMLARTEGMLADELAFIESELGRSAHLAGDEFSAADVQMTFPLEFATYSGVVGERHTGIRDYLVRMQARAGYRRAVAAGGAYLFDPASAPEASPFPLPKR